MMSKCWSLKTKRKRDQKWNEIGDSLRIFRDWTICIFLSTLDYYLYCFPGRHRKSWKSAGGASEAAQLRPYLQRLVFSYTTYFVMMRMLQEKQESKTSR